LSSERNSFKKSKRFLVSDLPRIPDGIFLRPWPIFFCEKKIGSKNLLSNRFLLLPFLLAKEKEVALDGYKPALRMDRE